MKQNYKHLLTEVILYLSELQRRLVETDKLKPEDKAKHEELIYACGLDSLRLLHALDPCLEDAKKELPQFITFLDSCSSALVKLKKDLKS